MKTLHLFLFVTGLAAILDASGQTGISQSGSLPDPSSMLDVSSTSLGFLPPRMSSQQRDAISNPARALCIYNLDSDCLNYYNGSEWLAVCGSPLTSGGGFICGSMLMDADANSYNTIQIGAQCWMQEDLKTTKYRNGDEIDYPGADNALWSTNTSGAYAWYENDPDNAQTYGALYNWHAVNNPANICPQGWKVPSNSDWTNLTDHLGGLSVAGGKMKATGTDLWLTPNTGATNESGFTAFPGGRRYSWGESYHQGEETCYWTATEHCDYTQFSFGRWLYYTWVQIEGGYDDKANGHSVRCIKE